jgi:DNA polymerase III delta prime subunit
MIGQYSIRIRLAEMNRFPRFVILEGVKGSGKRTLAEWIVHHESCDSEIVESQKVDDIRAVIESSLTLHGPKMYIFPDAHSMNVQAQNALLKTLEEPTTNAYYLMTVNSLDNVLSTIKSRAHVITMEGYTRDQLSEFTDDPVLLDICTTPGQIKRYAEIDYADLIEHSQKVLDNIGRISVANVFNILSHIKEENYDLVIPTLQYILWKRIQSGVNPQDVISPLKIIQETSGLITYASTVNVRIALETMFLKLWEVS